MENDPQRTIGLVGATGVGVGAIVGGGILALAGTAFAVAGPAAILAFALNGVVAVITALSFAELSSRFPESGGTYIFAKKVVSVEAAFAVGWVVWFASIVAAALYAIGFAAFAVPVIDLAWSALGTSPSWLTTPRAMTAVAVLATLAYTGANCRGGGGGGAWMNALKVMVFAVLIAGGLWALGRSEPGTTARTLTPFLPQGGLGLVQAMGFTFIALQGFDLIAAVAGEVKTPARTVPRAMLLSLGTALVIYLPLLLVVATVGVSPGSTIGAESAANPETIVALAARQFLGSFGYWLVVVAALLSMLSALQANLFAASRVALAMAEDRTLPALLEARNRARGTPVPAILTTGIVVTVLLVLLPDVAAAGAAASLIFLVTFALAHGISILARRRMAAAEDAFRTPLFPLVPVVGGLLCVALAVFQAVVVPAAGTIAVVWLAIGGVLFLTLFAAGARVRDAASEAGDPYLLRLRGRSPLVLVPIANPANATAMVAVAHAMSVPGVGRVTLLNIVTSSGPDDDPDLVERRLASAQSVLRSSLVASFAEGLAAEALTTVARDVWGEIVRVARAHECESVLLGLSDIDGEFGGTPLERLIGTIMCDTVVLKTPMDWRLEKVERILVPVGGKGQHDELRARLVASLSRDAARTITYVRVVPTGVTDERRERVRRVTQRLAHTETRGRARVEVVESERVSDAVTELAAEADLVILGLSRPQRGRALFGELAPRIARETASAIVMISAR